MDVMVTQAPPTIESCLLAGLPSVRGLAAPFRRIQAADTGARLRGRSEPEDWGVWSEGEIATLLLDLPEKPAGDLQPDLLCRSVGHERFPCSFAFERTSATWRDGSFLIRIPPSKAT